MRPGPAVLAAFSAGTGAGTALVRLPGGQGTTWRAGPLVLKPAGDPRVARWTAGLYLSLSRHCEPGFRVPRPRRCQRGDWVVTDEDDGAWGAWQWLPGEPADWAGWPWRSRRWTL